MNFRIECDDCQASFKIKSSWEDPNQLIEFCPYCGHHLEEDNIEEVEDYE